MRIFKPLTREKDFFAESGERVRPEYILGTDDNGDPVLVKCGEIDIKEFINSFRDDCLIENIVKRYQNGDVSALNRVQGFYGDVTILPKDIHDASIVLNYAKEVYENLGEDIRKDYPDFDSFVGAFSTPESISKFVSGLTPVAAGAERDDNGGDVNEPA